MLAEHFQCLRRSLQWSRGSGNATVPGSVQNTALHLACLANKPSAINLLLTLRCELGINHDGFTAIDFCIKHKLADAARAMTTNDTSRSVSEPVQGTQLTLAFG